MRQIWRRNTSLLLALVASLNVAVVVYTWLYGAIATRSIAEGELRAVGFECLLLLLIWRRFRRAAWVARFAWCYLLCGIAFDLAGTLQSFSAASSTPPAVPYLLPVVPLLAVQVAALLAPAVRRHVWKSTEA